MVIGMFYLEGEFRHVVHGDRDDDDTETSDGQTGAVNCLVNPSDVRGVRVDGVKTENRHCERDYNVMMKVKVTSIGHISLKHACFSLSK